METPHRMPLHDLPLEQFLTGIVAASKTPRKHKRPLSPSRTTLLNPAKRRVLDAEGISLSNNVTISSHSHSVPFTLSNMHTVTPSRPSRLGNGLARNYGHSQATSPPFSSRRCSPSRQLRPQSTVESSTDPQSRHYPGFDIFRDSEQGRDYPVLRVTLPFGGGVSAEEDKENVPLRRRAKKLSSKKRLSSCLDGLDTTASAQTSKLAVHHGKTPFSARQALR